ncbi:hypothetical protein L3V79_09530 [Thiotrichales bacterium 19S9-12]|nr:hypothetical protein [Thiotrichales bacterium 19S9-12]
MSAELSKALETKPSERTPEQQLTIDAALDKKRIASYSPDPGSAFRREESLASKLAFPPPIFCNARKELDKKLALEHSNSLTLAPPGA